MQFGIFTPDFSVHRIKLLVLVRPTTAEFGTWENFMGVEGK